MSTAVTNVLSCKFSMKLKEIIFYAIISFNLFACSKKESCFCEGERPYQIHTAADYDACYRLENYRLVC